MGHFIEREKKVGIDELRHVATEEACVLAGVLAPALSTSPTLDGS